MKKKLVSMLLTLIMTAVPLTCSAAAITVDLNGSILETPQAPVMENGTTLVPFRPIFEGMGLTVDWNPTTQTVTGTNADYTIQLTIGSTIAKVNGESKTMAVAPKVVNGATLIPVRFIAESVGYYVGWDNNLQKVILRSDDYSKSYRLLSDETVYLKDLYATQGTGEFADYRQLHGFVYRGFDVYFNGSTLHLDDKRGLDLNERIPFVYENYSTISRLEAYQLMSKLGLKNSQNMKSYFGKFYDEWNFRNMYYNNMFNLRGHFISYESGAETLADIREKQWDVMMNLDIVEQDWLTETELRVRGLDFTNHPVTGVYRLIIPGFATTVLLEVADYDSNKLPDDGTEVNFNGLRMKKENGQLYFNREDIERLEAAN